ncbi:37-kD nucleoid-associated bacterial protein [Clostridium puniceum]|uniref:37-kD nucleoid-associated bacterial protein n=1 Tax=Clostridium puniceum TaxID=29367 RepID=A0A1S8TVI0_9CLOT|nr:nucleoid-associated protein [Clostridium puniceum]OOM81803.1 37-kD nucleoid-associated bacterial protein [Clostridium puniceum]
MEYINDISINEAVIHILDSNADEPVLNEYSLELGEDIYKYIYKHTERALNDDNLAYGKFKEGRNIVKEVVQDYLNGVDSDLIHLSKELARQLFFIMKGNVNIPVGDLIIVSLVTDQGPMVGILKMDYVKNFTHEIQFKEEKIGIDIIPQLAGLPSNKINKAAFIKPIREDEIYNLYILDKQKVTKEDEYGANYFLNSFLGATYITNERDSTKNFIKYSEEWVRRNIPDDAAKAEEVRSAIKNKLKEEETFNIDKVAEELFNEEPVIKESFAIDMKMKCASEEVYIDERYIDKRLKRVRLNIDKEIDLYINLDTYTDKSKFEVIRNGDGSINLIIKNVINYIEK